MEPKEKKAFEPSGLVPRSIVRTFERFRQQLLPGSETAAIREYRISRYQVLVSARCLFTLLIIPIATNWLVSSWLLSPLVEHFWNTQQNEIFLNSYQEERAFAELESFSKKLFFESLLNTTSTINVDFTPYAQNSSATNSMFDYSPINLVNRSMTKATDIPKGYTKKICTRNIPSEAKEFVSIVNNPLGYIKQYVRVKSQYNTQVQRSLPYKSGTDDINATWNDKAIYGFVKTCNICNSFSSGAAPAQPERASETIDFTPIFNRPFGGEDCFTYPFGVDVQSKEGMTKPLEAEYLQSNERLFPHTLLFSPKEYDQDLLLRQQNIPTQWRSHLLEEEQRGPGQRGRQSLASNLSIILPQKGGNFAEINRSVPSLLSVPLESTSDNSLKIKEKVQNKILELAIYYNQQTIISITNIIGDVVSLVTLGCLFIWMKPEITILKSFLIEAIYSLSDTTKSFLLILLTDLLVGFHSPRGWETALELLLKHFGLPENQDFVFLFVATFPVLLDTVFKYWIFRHLNKISPSTVATYHSMIE